MELKNFISKQQRGYPKVMSERLGITNIYFNAIINKRRSPSKNLAQKIEHETKGKVTILELLFPDKNRGAAAE